MLQMGNNVDQGIFRITGNKEICFGFTRCPRTCWGYGKVRVNLDSGKRDIIQTKFNMLKNTNLIYFLPRPYSLFNKLMDSVFLYQFAFFLLLLSISISCNSIGKNENRDSEKKIKFTATEIYKNNVFNTVTVLTTEGIGSGFFIDSNKVVTNYHVVAGMNNAEIMLNNSDKKHSVTGYLSVDKMNDLILLQVDYTNQTWIPIESTPPQPGESIFAIGSPIGLSKTISEGIVSSIRNFNDKKLLQITTPISHGSSGSPVLNESGKLVGVAVGGIEDGNNIGFCIPSTLVNSLFDFREQFTRSLDQLGPIETKSIKDDQRPKTNENSSLESAGRLIEKRYIGKHAFGVQFNDESENLGLLTIERKNGRYTLRGSQKNSQGLRVELFGKIEIIDINNFVFHGTINVYKNQTGSKKPDCKWSGDASFVCLSYDKLYWRNEDSDYDDACWKWLGYIDIYFDQ